MHGGDKLIIVFSRLSSVFFFFIYCYYQKQNKRKSLWKINLNEKKTKKKNQIKWLEKLTYKKRQTIRDAIFFFFFCQKNDINNRKKNYMYFSFKHYKLGFPKEMAFKMLYLYSVVIVGKEYIGVEIFFLYYKQGNILMRWYVL